MPEDFDDTIEIVVDEQAEAIENDEEEVLYENGKPFWMRYFKADYLGESNPKNKKLLLQAGIKTDMGKIFWKIRCKNDFKISLLK